MLLTRPSETMPYYPGVGVCDHRRLVRPRTTSRNLVGWQDAPPLPGRRHVGLVHDRPVNDAETALHAGHMSVRIGLVCSSGTWRA